MTTHLPGCIPLPPELANADSLDLDAIRTHCADCRAPLDEDAEDGLCFGCWSASGMGGE
jgi:hypothetical protein